MVLGELLVPGRPASLDYSRARAFCACRRCGWGVVWTFFLSSIVSLLSPSLWETARYRLKYCLKGPLNPIQPTNQPTDYILLYFLLMLTLRYVESHQHGGLKCWPGKLVIRRVLQHFLL